MVLLRERNGESGLIEEEKAGPSFGGAFVERKERNDVDGRN